MLLLALHRYFGIQKPIYRELECMHSAPVFLKYNKLTATRSRTRLDVSNNEYRVQLVIYLYETFSVITV